jgi:hypothetical protein
MICPPTSVALSVRVAARQAVDRGFFTPFLPKVYDPFTHRAAASRYNVD